MMTPYCCLLTLVLAAEPTVAKFQFVDAFGPEERAAPRYRVLTLGRSPPRPLVGAPEPTAGTEFALARVGTGPESALGVVWQPKVSGGPFLWLDADGDGKLSSAERHAFPARTLELPATVRIGKAGQARTMIFRRGAGDSLYVAVRGHTRGRLMLGEKQYASSLADGDADGCFDSAGSDRIWIDFDGDGKFDPLTEQFPLGTPVAIGGSHFLIRPDPTGIEVRVTTRGSEMGKLKPLLMFQPGCTIREIEINLISEFGELVVLKSLDVPADLPIGKYRIEAMVVRATDAKGRLWKFRFGGDREFVLDVAVGKTTTADLLHDLAFTTGVKDARAAPDGMVLVSPMWQTPAGVYLAECELNGSTTGADIVLVDSGGTVLDRTVSGFR